MLAKKHEIEIVFFRKLCEITINNRPNQGSTSS